MRGMGGYRESRIERGGWSVYREEMPLRLSVLLFSSLNGEDLKHISDGEYKERRRSVRKEGRMCVDEEEMEECGGGGRRIGYVCRREEKCFFVEGWYCVERGKKWWRNVEVESMSMM